MPADTTTPPLRQRLAALLLVRDHEVGPAAHFVVLFLLLGAGLAIGRGTTDALFFKRFGIEHLPLTYVALSGCLAVASVVYAAFVDRLAAERTFQRLFLAQALALGGCWWSMSYATWDWVYPLYYLVYEVVSEILLVHGALYLSHNLDTLQSKRLTALVFAGAQVGLIGGGLLLATAAPVVGVHNLLLVWIGITLLAQGQLLLWHRRRGASPFHRAARHGRAPVRTALHQVHQALAFTRDSDLLRNTAFSTFFMVVAFYVLVFNVNRVYTVHFPNEESLTAFFGLLAAVTGGLALMLQLLVTNRVIERFGIQTTGLVYPTTSLGSYLAMAIDLNLASALLASFTKDTVMPAFRKPVSPLFFNALPGNMQGRARAMTVMLVMPLALLACGATLWLMQRVQGPFWLVLPGLLAAVLHLHFTRRKNRAYVAALITHLRERLYLPTIRRAACLRGGDREAYATLARGLDHPDEQVALSFARALAAMYPERATVALAPRLGTMSPAAADQVLRLLQRCDEEPLAAPIGACLASDDAHLRATALERLFHCPAADGPGLARDYLASPNPRLAATAVRGVLRHRHDALRALALGRWRALLEDGLHGRLAAFELVPLLVDLNDDEAAPLRRRSRQALVEVLEGDSDDLRLRALRGFDPWPGPPLPELEPVLGRLCSAPNPRLRATAVRCLGLLPPAPRDSLLLAAVSDVHAEVSGAAVEVLRRVTPRFEILVLNRVAENNIGPPRSQRVLLEALMETGLRRDLATRILHTKLEEARWLRRVRADLPPPPAPRGPHALAGYALEERFQQTVDLVLLALTPLADSEAVGVVRAALKSCDARQRANATEALRELAGRELAPVLSTLVQGDDPGPPTARSPAALWRELLEWSRRRRDGWITLLAQAALGRIDPAEDDAMADIFERIALLKQAPFFSEVATDDLRMVAQAMDEEVFFPGERVFDINEQGDHMYIVLSGRIGISISPDVQAREFIVELGPGESFGEMNLLDQRPRSGTAHVLAETRLLTLEKDKLRGLLLTHPELGLGMLRAFSMRLRESHRRAKALERQVEDR